MGKHIWFISHPSGGAEHTPTFFKALEKFQAEHNNVDFIMPHAPGGPLVELTKDDVEKATMVIAEVSIASTGSGIELGWASALGKDIIAFHQGVTPISPAVPLVATAIHVYISEKDIVKVLETLV